VSPAYNSRLDRPVIDSHRAHELSSHRPIVAALTREGIAAFGAGAESST
jgi:hypothetical protein